MMPFWMPIRVAETTGRTSHLNCVQAGCYFRLLLAMWMTEDGTLPEDGLCRAAGAHPPRWARTWEVLKPLFIVVDGRVTLPGLQDELTKARSHIAMAQAKGRLGGLKAQSIKASHRLPMNGSKPLNNNNACQAGAQHKTIEKKKGFQEGAKFPMPKPQLQSMFVPNPKRWKLGDPEPEDSDDVV
jgi:uncharacterized protein YdaU (DUF1376 family)